jgi:hypothetical protein
MDRDRPELIKPRHLARKSVAYVRQSTCRQVVENEGARHISVPRLSMLDNGVSRLSRSTTRISA